MQVRRRFPWGVHVAAVLGLAVAVSGCGTFARSAPPTGVDQLTIPTAEPDPADFSVTVDNPWFPLGQGRVNTYAVELPSGGEGVRTMSVQSGVEEIAGVPTTVVVERLTAEHGRILDRAFLFYAQDRDGNVWWFGRRDADPRGSAASERAERELGPGTDDSWRAGDDGAEAGLAMAAEPRLGDGYRPAHLPGEIEQVATVVEIEDERVEVGLGPGGGNDEAPDPAEGGSGAGPMVTEVYEPGFGLTRRVDETSGLSESLTSSVTR